MLMVLGKNINKPVIITFICQQCLKLRFSNIHRNTIKVKGGKDVKD